MSVWTDLIEEVQVGKFKAIARSISLVENEYAGYEHFLENLPPSANKIIGITGPPGAGKSTLTDALIGTITEQGKKVAVLCVDPSSPFHLGALLGDRIRMSDWYNHPSVFIRSLASRGSVGGLHPKIMEISDVLKVAPFDYIIIETVGVGQSEIEIAGLADATVIVLVPEAGDEIQNMKAGLMEVGQIFVVNKADRPGADRFIANLKHALSGKNTDTDRKIDIIKTVATAKEGLEALMNSIERVLSEENSSDKKYHLMAEKFYYLLQQKRMKDVNKHELFKQFKEQQIENIYKLLK